jgi:hypothetical protein
MALNLWAVLGVLLQLFCAVIHGAPCNHNYWDFGTVDEARYSYARDVAARGFPTFAIDLLAVNRGLQSDDTVARSAAFMGQVDFIKGRRSSDSTEEQRGLAREEHRGLAWNDGLPWNCGGVSGRSQ